MAEASLQNDPFARVQAAMQIITADGRCAGHVDRCTMNQIYMAHSGSAIPKEWIRRVDRDVYISKRWHELDH
ncbi:MAG: DUF2171 domain-containing protein [Pseudomonadota bacterium]